MTGGPRPPAAATVLQRALAAEQAATYGYGVLGAHLSGAQQATATQNWTAHQEARDRLSALLTRRGVAPVPAAVAYRLPGPVGTAAQARSLAVLLEERVCAAYIAVVGLTGAGLRDFAAGQVRACALRAAAWRGATVPFPGLAGPGSDQAGPGRAGQASRSGH